MSGRRRSTPATNKRKRPTTNKTNEEVSITERTGKDITNTNVTGEITVTPGNSEAAIPFDGSSQKVQKVSGGSTTAKSTTPQSAKSTTKSKYIAEKPAKVMPPAAANALKTKAVTLFGSIKFFVSKEKVDDTPHIMDFVFNTVNWKGEDLDNKLRRCKHWEAAKNQVYQEINKLRANKITAFNHIVQGAS
jgi:hypothetical protein